MVAPEQPQARFENIPLRDFQRTDVVASHYETQQSINSHHVVSEESSLMENPMNPSKMTAFRRALDRLWAWEILSCFLAAASLAVIVATLATHDGQPLPQWPHLITINSLIATFAAIFKASMLMPIAEGISELKWSWFDKPRHLSDLDKMDTASRGPWGALLLLLGMKSYFLAGLGAVITIVALAVDPFTQQIVQYYNCLQPVPNIAAIIPKTNNYTGFNPHIGAGMNELDPKMAVAVYIGVLDPPANTSVSIAVDCPTGNCTFPYDNGATFSTLGVCHTCHDISDLITNQRTSRSGGNMTLASGAWLSYGGRPDAVSSVEIWEGGPLTLYSFESLIRRKEDFFAARCSLYPCVITYGSNVTDTVYTETQVSVASSKHVIPVEDLNEPWSMVMDRTLINGTWHDCLPSTARTDVNTVPTTENKTVIRAIEVPDDALWYPPDCVYAMTRSAIRAFNQYLNQIWGNQTLFGIYRSAAYVNTTTGPLWLKGLYHNATADITTVNQYMEGLTIALSAAIRTNGDTPSSDYVKGTVLLSQTCVRARWVWISLPATLFGLTVVFMTCTVLQTKDHRGYWKSSAIALLFHGFDARTRRGLGMVRDRGEMYEIAEHVRVQLQFKDGGWSFVRNK